jgi:hypothetical protein
VLSDYYYVQAEFGDIIHVYPDWSWDSDKAPSRVTTLDEYFAWLQTQSRGFRSALTFRWRSLTSKQHLQRELNAARTATVE